MPTSALDAPPLLSMPTPALDAQLLWPPALSSSLPILARRRGEGSEGGRENQDEERNEGEREKQEEEREAKAREKQEEERETKVRRESLDEEENEGEGGRARTRRKNRGGEEGP